MKRRVIRLLGTTGRRDSMTAEPCHDFSGTWEMQCPVAPGMAAAIASITVPCPENEGPVQAGHELGIFITRQKANFSDNETTNEPSPGTVSTQLPTAATVTSPTSPKATAKVTVTPVRNRPIVIAGDMLKSTNTLIKNAAASASTASSEDDQPNCSNKSSKEELSPHKIATWPIKSKPTVTDHATIVVKTCSTVDEQQQPNCSNKSPATKKKAVDQKLSLKATVVPGDLTPSKVSPVDQQQAQQVQQGQSNKKEPSVDQTKTNETTFRISPTKALVVVEQQVEQGTIGFTPAPPTKTNLQHRQSKPIVQRQRAPPASITSAAAIIANLALSPRQARKILPPTETKMNTSEMTNELAKGSSKSPPPPSTDSISSSSRPAGADKPRIQTIIMRKKQRTECFAGDGNQQQMAMMNKENNNGFSEFDHGKVALRSKSSTRNSEGLMMIVNDPQKLEVSATVSLSRAAKLQRAQSFAAPATPAPFKAIKPPAQSTAVDEEVKAITKGSSGSTKGLGTEMHVASFANKLSRSFFDLTAGSTDRLQKWKSMLGNRKRHKDTSEPPPVNRSAISGPGAKMPTAMQLTTAGDEILVDWSSSSNRSAPRQLHASRSMGNALLESTLSVDSLVTNSESAELAEMEHRTLKQRQELMMLNNNNNSKEFTNQFQNVKNLKQLVQTIDGISKTSGLTKELPPPARITPYSGVKPQDSDIVRPIAFRPLVLNRKEDRQSSVSSNGSSYSKPNGNNHNTVNQNNGNGGFMQRNNGFASQQSIGPANADQRLGAGPKPFVPPPTGYGSTRPKPIYQASTSDASAFCTRHTTIGNEENDYDVVSEYIDDAKNYNSADEMGSHPPNSNNNSSRLSGKQMSQSSSNICAINAANSAKVKKSPSNNSHNNNINHNGQQTSQYATNSSNGSRHSSGIHVTPSPSDSGIVDYETIIRDKETELANVRSTMEANEEIIVRVYQDKERQWREQLAELRQRLAQSQHAEAAGRQQSQRMQDQRDQLACTVQNLRAEKEGLQRKCLQVEQEMFNLRKKLDTALRERLHGVCENCQIEIGATKQQNGPVPAPRHTKESTSERELRSEVELLRQEVSTVRETLANQFAALADERQRFESRVDQQPQKSLTNGNHLQLNNGLEEYAHLKAKKSNTNIVVSRDRLI